MAITIKTPQDIETLRTGGRKLAVILNEVAGAVRPGITTGELNDMAETLIRDAGGVPSFRGYRAKKNDPPFPCCLCTSVNSEVVHTIPDAQRVLREGDIIGLDIGMWWPGEAQTKKDGPRALCTDTAVTVGVGAVSDNTKTLMQETKRALDIGIAAAHPGASVGDVGYAIERHLNKFGFGIIRDLAGHGVGYEVHEDPYIPNYGAPGTGPALKAGMAIAIEPMATLGGEDISLREDGWTLETRDKSLAAHFEHTLVITDEGPEVVTTAV